MGLSGRRALAGPSGSARLHWAPVLRSGRLGANVYFGAEYTKPALSGDSSLTSILLTIGDVVAVGAHVAAFGVAITAALRKLG